MVVCHYLSRMILYNITVIIEDSIEKEWLLWIDSEFVPKVLSSELMVSSRLLKVLDSPNEGLTYCLQFVADSHEDYYTFKTVHASSLLDAHTLKFKNQALFFSTLMEYIN